MGIISIPAGAKKVEFEARVIGADGKPKEDVAPVTLVWHINPFINLWLHLGLVFKRAWFHVKRFPRQLWSKIWQQS